MPYLLSEQYAVTLNDILQHIDTEEQNVDVQVHAADAHAAEHALVLGLGTLEKAQAQEVSFLTNPRYTQQLLTTQATWVILHPQTAQRALELQPREQYPSAWIVCNHPYLLYAKIAQWFAQKHLLPPSASIHPTAVVDSSAVLGDGVVIGPHVVIEAQAQIAEHVRIDAGCFVGRQAKIGAYTHLRPRVTIYHEVVLGHHVNIHSGSVIGADGFGFAPDKRTENLVWEKIPQFGTVHIGNYVDIGANTTIDRGALENTIIGDRAILDNQIQIAHNVQVGEATAIAGCAAIAGSSTVGKNCILGGGSEISGHLTIADNVHISGGTPVIGSISKPGMYTGVFPTTEHHEWEKNAVILRKLSVLRKKVIDLESQITTS